MLIVLLSYKKTLNEVDFYLKEHREYLEEGYQQNFFIASGPRNPRTGGVIISQLTDKEKLEKILLQDPFIKNNIADYEIIDFNPIKYHAQFVDFIPSM